MKVITEALDLKGKRVFVRVDWNISEGDIYRIEVSMPTIKYLLEQGAEVILATHSKNIEELRKFVPEGATLLPNLRDNPGEEANSEEFAEELAAQADIYINEAFSVSHRKHASVVTLPKLLPSYAGLRFVEEIKQLSKAFNPAHPFLLLLGGAKIETKLAMIDKFSKIADTIFVGGAMAAKAAQMGLAENYGVLFPKGDLAALDANEETLRVLRAKIIEARFTVWNGPLGKYEDGYTTYTHELAKALSEAPGEVIIGGGDTLAVTRDLQKNDKFFLNKFSFVSTAGGAMLEFLATETLPGIEALG